MQIKSNRLLSIAFLSASFSLSSFAWAAANPTDVVGRDLLIDGVASNYLHTIRQVDMEIPLSLY